MHRGGDSKRASRQACKTATAEFARISSAIKDIEGELTADDKGGSGLAKWVRKLQEAERNKLQLTIGMQVAFTVCEAQNWFTQATVVGALTRVHFFVSLEQVERKRLGGVHEALDLVSKAGHLGQERG